MPSYICYHSADFSFFLQEKEQSVFAAASPACENDQCSPISILRVSFSNEGSLSESPNGSSGMQWLHVHFLNSGIRVFLLDLRKHLKFSFNLTFCM